MTTTTHPPSTELEQFYADIIVTAVEGGIGSYAQIEEWGEHIWGHPHTTVATVCSLDTSGEDFTDLLPEGVTLPVAIGIKEIGKVFSRFMAEPDTDFGIHSSYIGGHLGAWREKDAGEIDAYEASAIFQVALFGKAHLG